MRSLLESAKVSSPRKIPSADVGADVGAATLGVVGELGGRNLRRFVTAFAISIAAVLALGATAAGAAQLTRAFTDDVWFTQPTSQAAQQWVQRTQATNAKLVLLEVDWTSIEPTAPPPGIDPTDPSGPQFNFGYLDSRVRQFTATGLTVAFLVTNAPRWAEAPGGPANFEAAGSWEPNATAFGQAATALARRYSGSYPDPLSPGQPLPRVRYFQAWGEANFSIHLAPQWTRKGSVWTPTGPALYRGLLNAFYAGVKSVHADDVVITTGFGPYGDSPGGCVGSQGVGAGCRMHPALFARELLCLHGERLRPESCPSPAHFDVMAIDPYQVSSPTTRAYNIDDVSSPDLGKLTRVLKRAVSLRRAVPHRHKPLWVTEFSYDSNPPNPGAVSLATQARWLEEAFYLFWKQGVSTVVWYLLRDQAPSFQLNDYYSGVYYYSGKAKPAAEAFRFPFVVWTTGSRATVWGIAPQSGALSVQRKQGRGWRTLLKLHVSAGAVFVRTISPKLRGSFRAVVAGESSLAWRR